MKNNLYFILISIVFLNFCTSEKSFVIEGVYYKKLIDLGSLYPMTNQEITEALKNVKEKELLHYYNLLKTDDLIDKPFINLITNNNEKIKVYLNKEPYQKIIPYINSKVLDTGVIKINAFGQRTKHGFYWANEINKIEIRKGKTQIIK